MLACLLEATGSAMNYFWRLVQQQEFPYQRVNHLVAVLKRGRIRSRTERVWTWTCWFPRSRKGT